MNNFNYHEPWIPHAWLRQPKGNCVQWNIEFEIKIFILTDNMNPLMKNNKKSFILSENCSFQRSGELLYLSTLEHALKKVFNIHVVVDYILQ